MEFPKQEYWNGLPFPSPGHLLNPGIKPGSPALQADSLPSQPTTTVPMIQYKDTDRIQAIVVLNSMRNKMSIFITKKLIHTTSYEKFLLERYFVHQDNFLILFSK